MKKTSNDLKDIKYNGNKDHDVLVIGPGGFKGFIMLGSLLYLEECLLLETIKTFVGVSVGSVLCLLLVSGYSPKDIIEESFGLDFMEDFLSINLTFIKDNHGLISNTKIKERLSDLVEQKFGCVPSMNELYQMTGLELSCITLNLSQHKTIEINRHTEPDMSCIEAVMMSMNIPLVFYKIKYKGDIYVDGALGNPFPVNLYNDNKRNVIGIYVETELPDIDSILGYAFNLIFDSMDRLSMSSMENLSDKINVIYIRSSCLNTLGIAMTESDKAKLVAQGYSETHKYITGIVKKVKIVVKSET